MPHVGAFGFPLVTVLPVIRCVIDDGDNRMPAAMQWFRGESGWLPHFEIAANLSEVGLTRDETKASDMLGPVIVA
jgi:hypothetical protein